MKLTIRDLTKRYGKVMALKNFSAEFEPGIIGILGPNGAGKSTLMNMITTVLAPTSGSILLNDIPIGQIAREYRGLLGVLPQNPPVYHNVTAKWYLEYMAYAKGIEKKKIPEEINRVLAAVELTDAMHKKIGTFSGGMRQRIGIAQALLGDPGILVLDEPTAGLDPQQRILFKNLVMQLSTRRIVLISTHIVSDLEGMANRILMLKQGENLGMKAPEQWLEQSRPFCFEITIPENRIQETEQSYSISRITIHDGQASCVIVADGKPAGSQPAEPTLEEVYLHYFGKKGQ